MARSAYRLMFAGAAFAAFGVMAGRAMIGLMDKTSKGNLVLDDFRRTWDRFTGALGESITEYITPTIDNIIRRLDKLSQNQTWLDLRGRDIVWTITLLIGMGGALAIAGITGKFFATFILPLLTLILPPGAKVLLGMAGVKAAGAIATIALPVAIALVVTGITWQLIGKERRQTVLEWLGNVWKRMTTGEMPGAWTFPRLSTTEWTRPSGEGGTGLWFDQPIINVDVDIYGNEFATDRDLDEIGSEIANQTIDEFMDQMAEPRE